MNDENPFAQLIVQYNNKIKISKTLIISDINPLVIDKNVFLQNNIAATSISNIEIKIKCKNYFLVVIDNNAINSAHFELSSYSNFRSSISALKLFNIPLVHIINMDINHMETYYSSPLIVRCNIEELYTGCEINNFILNNAEFKATNYSVDIRRDTVISKFSGDGNLSVNIQESSVKEFNIRRITKDGKCLTSVDCLRMWNGSHVNNFNLSALANQVFLEDSTIDKLKIGKSKIKKINLSNVIIEICSVDKDSFDTDSTSKWVLKQRSSLYAHDRKNYVKSSYMINKNLAKNEIHWYSKILLKLFSIVCGYGYKPFRTIIFSAILIIAWAIIYKTFVFFQPNCLSYSSNHTVKLFTDCLYYSGITFTTLGYGDIIPVISAVKILSILEAGTGVSMLSLFVFSLTKTLTEYTQN